MSAKSQHNLQGFRFGCFCYIFIQTQAQQFEYFDDTDSTFLENGRKVSNYRGSTGESLSKNDKFVENLNNILHTFETCLVHIINYDGIDISVEEIPIVLSRYDVVETLYLVNSSVLSKYISYPLYSHRQILYAYERTPNNKTEIKWCKRHRLDMECIHIPYIDNTVISRPWFCDIHFYLFPPLDPRFYMLDPTSGNIKILIPGSFKRMFWTLQQDNIKIRDGYTEDVILVNRARYDVLVSTGIPAIEEFWINAMSEFTVNWYDIAATTQRELLIANTKQLVYRNALQTHNILKISNIFLLCRTCNPNKILDAIPIDIPENFVSFLDKIYQINNMNKYNLVYKMWPLGEALVNGFFRFGEKLPNTKDWRELNDLITNREISLNYLRWEIEARLLGDVLYNATVVVIPFGCKYVHGTACNDFFQPYVSIFPSGSQDYAHFHFHRRTLTFVSCGTPEQSALAFDQLVSVFDNYVWMYLIISVFSTAAFCGLIQMYRQVPELQSILGKARNENLQKQNWRFQLKVYLKDYLFPSIMSYFKVLIEQGDPINIQLWNVPCLGYTFACFLFVAVVISNAYKNENITQLTLPRASIPYDTFDLLISNNFTVYTRGVIIGGFYENRAITHPVFANLFRTTIALQIVDDTRGGHHLSTVLRSEVFDYGHSEISYRNFFLSPKYFSDKVKHIMNHTRIITKWFDMLGDTTGSCSFLYKNNTCDPLRLCNKTAFVLPNLDAHTKFYQMKRDGYQNVFLGRDELIQNKFGIAFTRWVHPVILQRMNSLYASGVIEWWDKYVLDFLSRLRVGFYDLVEDSPTASSLDGNIVVVFTVLPVGILASIVALIYELRNKFKVWYRLLMILDIRNIRKYLSHFKG